MLKKKKGPLGGDARSTEREGGSETILSPDKPGQGKRVKSKVKHCRLFRDSSEVRGGNPGDARHESMVSEGR